MRTARSKYRMGVPGQRPPWTEIPSPGQRPRPLDRDPLPWTQTTPLGQKPPAQKPPQIELPRQRPPSWTETPLLDRDRPPEQRHPGQ